MGIAARLLFLLAGVIGIAAEARADDNSPPQPQVQSQPPRWYAAVSGSLVYVDKVKISPTTTWYSNDFGYGYSVATGFRVLPEVRWELEVSGRESTAKRSDVSLAVPAGYQLKPNESTYVMTNAYYDLHNATQFVPYVGAGIGDGYIRTPFRATGVGHLEGWALSYQFMAGIGYEFSDSAAVNLGYRYVSGEDVKMNAGNYSFHNTSNNIEAGFRFFLN